MKIAAPGGKIHRLFTLICGGAAIRSEVEGKGQFCDDVLVPLIRQAALAALYTYNFAGFIRAVLQQLCKGGLPIRAGRETVDAHVGFAHIINVVGIREAVCDLHPYIHTVVDGVFCSDTEWQANAHAIVGLPVGICGIALSFSGQRAQKHFLTPVKSIRVVTKNAHTQRYVWREPVVGIPGHELEEVEVPLEGQFEYVGIEAKVPPGLKFVISIVDV